MRCLCEENYWNYMKKKRLTIIASLSASMTLDSIVLSKASTKSCIPPPASARRRTKVLSAPEPIPKACTLASLAWFFTRATVPSVLLMAPSVSTNICNYNNRRSLKAGSTLFTTMHCNWEKVSFLTSYYHKFRLIFFQKNWRASVLFWGH